MDCTDETSTISTPERDKSSSDGKTQLPKRRGKGASRKRLESHRYKKNLIEEMKRFSVEDAKKFGIRIYNTVHPKVNVIGLPVSLKIPIDFVKEVWTMIQTVVTVELTPIEFAAAINALLRAKLAYAHRTSIFPSRWSGSILTISSYTLTKVARMGEHLPIPVADLVDQFGRFTLDHTYVPVFDERTPAGDEPFQNISFHPCSLAPPPGPAPKRGAKTKRDQPLPVEAWDGVSFPPSDDFIWKFAAQMKILERYGVTRSVSIATGSGGASQLIQLRSGAGINPVWSFVKVPDPFWSMACLGFGRARSDLGHYKASFLRGTDPTDALYTSMLNAEDARFEMMNSMKFQPLTT